LAGKVWNFATSFGKGAYKAAAGTVEGLASLAKGGYALAASSEARAEAWETAKKAANAVKEYGAATWQDPAKPFKDARAVANSAYSAFDAAKKKAEEEGRSAEFWGELTGAAGFELGSLAIPVSKAGKAAKAAEAAKAVDKAGDAARAVKAADAAADAVKAADHAEDAATAAGKARQALKNPAKAAPDEPVSAVKKCPLEEAGKNPQSLADKPEAVSSPVKGPVSGNLAVEQQLDEIYARAPAAKAEINDISDGIAKELGGKVSKPKLKGRGRAMEKVLKDYKGDATQLKDVARNTIVVPRDKYEDAILLFQKKMPETKPKIIKPETDPLGYSGTNAVVQTKAGIPAEIQINTPEMIFAKEKPIDAIGILGQEEYSRIAEKAGVPGGRGHVLYEEYRSLEIGNPRREVIEEESREYYDLIRRKMRE
jgi:hypothetical protein